MNEKDELRKIYKDCLSDCFKKLMKELGMNAESFCEKVIEYENMNIDELLDTEIQNFKSYLYRSESYFPIKYINVIEIELGKKNQKERETCSELWKMWRNLEQYRENLKPFFDMSDDDLFWITNNLEELLKIPEKNIVFLYSLDFLNDEGKNKFLNYIPYILKDLGLKINNEKQFNSFFIEKDAYRLKNKVDCLLKLENCVDLYKDISPEDRKLRASLWNKYRYMDELDKKIYSLFASYNDKNPRKISDEQKVIIAIIDFLGRDSKYSKE